MTTNRSTSHPLLDGTLVLIGDLLEADDPDRIDPATGDPVVVQFHVGSITYDHGNWLHKADEPVGWTVAAALDVDETDFEFPLSECRRAAGSPPADEVLVRLGKAADDLAELDHGGPLEQDIRTAMAQLQAAVAPLPLRVETYRTETPATDLPDSDVLVEHRWRVVHTSNGEIMASGEGYTDRRDRDHAVATLWPGIDVVEADQ